MIAFLLTPIGRWLAGLAIAGTLIGAADIYISIHEYNKGWTAAVSAIAAKDKEALNAVNKATANVDACYSGGGTWDASSGLCSH